MDKFGIFKLLNSFLSFYKDNKNQTENNANSSINFADLLSSFSRLSNNDKNLQTSPTKNEQTPKENNDNNTLAPLQFSMLNTMESHDKFVKRVKEKNKQL